MKAFVLETALPLVTAILLVLVLTFAVFDPVPMAPQGPTAARALPPRATGRTPQGVAPAAAESGGAAMRTPPNEGSDEDSDERLGPPRKREMNEVMAHAIRVLGASRSGRENDESARVDPNLGPALGTLAEAVNVARNAKDDRDLLRAEELMRKAREEMESSCGEPGNPLCQSAESIKDLGY